MAMESHHCEGKGTMKKILIVLTAMLLLQPLVVYALEAIHGKVTELQPTGMPNNVAFKMDGGSASCPAGTWLLWAKSDPANNKAMYALILTALVSGKKVTMYITDGDTSCTGNHLRLWQDS